MLVKLSLLNFVCKAALWGGSSSEFETHFTSLSSCHPRNFYITTHKVATKEDESARIVCSRRIAFMISDVAHVVIDITADGISSPIAEVV